MRALRHPEIVILAAVVVLAGFIMRPHVGVPDVSAASRPPADPGDFELVIAADQDVYQEGERPVITATLTNRSDVAVMLARPLDGSDFGRFPQFMWTVTAPEDAPAPEMLGRCGNTNPITTGAFFNLPAGNSVEMSLPWCPVPSNELDCGPGGYSIQAMYSTDGDDPRSWVGGPLGDEALRAKQREIGPLLQQVPMLTLKSNVLEIRFEPGTESAPLPQ